MTISAMQLFNNRVYIVDILFNFKCNLLEFSLVYLASETSEYCTNERFGFFFYLRNNNHNENSARITTASYIKDSGNFATWSIFPSWHFFFFCFCTTPVCAFWKSNFADVFSSWNIYRADCLQSVTWPFGIHHWV